MSFAEYSRDARDEARHRGLDDRVSGLDLREFWLAGLAPVSCVDVLQKQHEITDDVEDRA